MALYDHAQRIADQHQIDVGIIEQGREAGVIAGQARDGLAVFAHLVQRGQRYRRTRRIAQLQMGIHAGSLKQTRSTINRGTCAPRSASQAAVAQRVVVQTAAVLPQDGCQQFAVVGFVVDRVYGGRIHDEQWTAFVLVKEARIGLV